MKAGDALYKFFTEAIGLKADDPGLKDFLSDPELAKTDINSVADFQEHFMTFQQAQKNKGLVQVIEENAKRTAYGEYATAAEGALRRWGKENGIEPDEMNAIFKEYPQQDRRLPAVLKLVAEKSGRSASQTKEAWELEKKNLWDENNALKRKIEEETERIQNEFNQKLTAKEKQMLLMEMKSKLPSVMKFRNDIPGLNDLQDLRLQNLLNKYHIVKNDKGEFDFFYVDDPKKEVFDEKGKPVSFGKMVGELFPISEFGETGNGGNGNGKTKTTTHEKTEHQNVSNEVKEKLESINANRPRMWTPDAE